MISERQLLIEYSMDTGNNIGNPEFRLNDKRYVKWLEEKYLEIINEKQDIIVR